jgi:hypothetical protein
MDLLLSRTEVIAIVPASKLTSNQPPRLSVWVRGALTGVALGLMVVFFIAWRLNPYEEDGTAKIQGTHRGLGLPPCTFLKQTGQPCPACGMTTSFALLVRGDVRNSLRANWVGTLLCAFGMLFVPWAAIVIVRGRSLFVRSLEAALIVFVSSLLVLMLLRWGIVLGSRWLAGEL